MADISKINPNGTEYNLKDATARADIQSSQTLKSSVVTVTDAAPINAEDITVDITPVQDLHGYDRPWAGGAGKNKLPMTSHTDIMTFIAENATGSVRMTGTGQNSGWANGIYISLSNLPAGNYIVSCEQNPNRMNVLVNWAFWEISPNGTPITVAQGDTVRFAWMVEAGQTYDCSISGLMLRLSTETDATFAPYSNECPIEGWTGAELDRVDVNIWDEEWEVGSLNADGTIHSGEVTRRTTSFIRVQPNTEYYFKTPIKGGRNAFYNKKKQIVAYNYDGISTDTFTTPNDAYYLRITFNSAYGTTYNNDISINYPSTDTSYHPYQGAQYTANFGETVYGGKWHVTEGGTDRTHGNIASYSGETINEPWLSSLDEYSPGATPTTGAQVVYPLTTPTTISTRKQNVPMLQGINTISASTGDVTLKYQPDNVIGELKGEIEDNIIYEDFKWTTNSSQSYSAGTPGTYGTSSWRDVKKEGYDVIGVTFVENRRFGDCILTLNYIPSTDHVEVIIFRATSSAVTIADEDIEYRVAYKKH